MDKHTLLFAPLAIMFLLSMVSLAGLGTSSLMNVVADFNSSYGLIALFISLMVAVGLIGINFFGTGENETATQTIIMGVGFMAIWGVFSIISLNLIVQIPTAGPIAYFGLTFTYVMGLLMNIGKG